MIIYVAFKILTVFIYAEKIADLFFVAHCSCHLKAGESRNFRDHIFGKVGYDCCYIKGNIYFFKFCHFNSTFTCKLKMADTIPLIKLKLNEFMAKHTL